MDDLLLVGSLGTNFGEIWSSYIRYIQKMNLLFIGPLYTNFSEIKSK